MSSQSQPHYLTSLMYVTSTQWIKHWKQVSRGNLEGSQKENRVIITNNYLWGITWAFASISGIALVVYGLQPKEKAETDDQKVTML